MRIKRYYREGNQFGRQGEMSADQSGHTLKTCRGVVLVEAKSVPAHRRWLRSAVKKMSL